MKERFIFDIILISCAIITWLGCEIYVTFFAKPHIFYDPPQSQIEICKMHKYQELFLKQDKSKEELEELKNLEKELENYIIKS